jgi:hypothetical protein
MNLKNYVEKRKPTLLTDPVKDLVEEVSQNIRSKGLSWNLNKK